VTLFDSPPATDIAEGFTYHVIDPTGLSGIDTTLRPAPDDTVIVSLPPATYEVTLGGIPDRCVVRSGLRQQVTLFKETNTGIARYVVSCAPSLGFAVYAFGPSADDRFIYELQGPSAQSGVIAANDSLYLTPLSPGDYSLRLGHVAGACEITSNGGRVQRFTVGATAGPFRAFTANCSDEAQRPRIVSLGSSYHDGALAFAALAVDPDRDFRRFWWDVTDCAGTSRRPTGGIDRAPINADRARADTLVLLHAVEVSLPDSVLAGACLALRLTDFNGNVSRLAEVPIGERGSRPTALQANAVFVQTRAIAFTIAATDPDGDFLGSFVAAQVRDGVLRPPDGFDDYVLRNLEGYVGTQVADLPLGSPNPDYADVNGAVVYVIDRRGNFSRYLDLDLFR
jgi:hypothetical protein